MSNPITTIRQALLVVVQTGLGITFKPLPFQYAVDKNDARSLEAGFAVRYGSITETKSEVDQVVVLEQDFELEITSRAYIRNSDDRIQDCLDSIYEKLSPLLNTIIMEKILIPATIQYVELRSLGEPHLIGEGRDLVSITSIFRVRYLNL